MSLCSIVIGLIVSLMAASLAARDEPVAPRARPPRLELDDPLEPFVAKEPRTQAEEDRLHAAALFATARTLDRLGESAAALAKYERAFRYDSQTKAILDEIVPLASGLGRHDEAVRYALIGAQRQATDPVLLVILAQYLSDRGDWKRSLQIYESLLGAQKNEEGGQTARTVTVRMAMGRLYFLMQEFDRASAAFVEVQSALRGERQGEIDDEFKANLLGDAGVSYRLFAECHLEAGQFEMARTAFEQAHKAGKKSRGVLDYNLARIAAKEKKPKLAIEKLQTYFDEKRSDEGLTPYELLVDLLRDLDQPSSARQRLEQLFEADPDNVSLGFFLAGRFLERDEFDRAKAIYSHLIKTSTAAADGRKKTQSLILAYRGLIEIDYKTKDVEALYDILGTTVLEASSLEVVESVAKQVAGDAKILAELDQIGDRRWQIDRDQIGGAQTPAMAQLAMAQLAMLARNIELAGKYYDRAVEKLPDRANELMLTWGLELYLANHYDEAVAVFTRGIEAKLLPENNPVYHGFLAEALEMDGKTDEALVAARRAVQIREDSVRTAARVPWIQYHASRYDEAIRGYRKLLETFGNSYETADTRNVLRESRFTLSGLYVIQDDFAAAEEVLEEVLDEFPEDIGALNDLGYLWVDQNKRVERSLAMIKTAVAADPANRAYLDSLGWAFYRLGRFEEAVTELEKAAKGGDLHNGVILDHLGDAYHQLGRAAEARSAWVRAVAAFESDDEEKEAKQTKIKIAKLGEEPDARIDD